MAWRLGEARALARTSEPFQQRHAARVWHLLVEGDSTGVGTGGRRPDRWRAGLLGTSHPRLAVCNRARDDAQFDEVVSQPAVGPGDPAAGFDAIIMNASGSDVSCGTDPKTLKGRWTGLRLQRRRTWRSASRRCAGKLKALGQLRVTRSELGPDLPTLTQQDLRGGVDLDMRFGLVAPAETPLAVVSMLNQKMAQIVVEPEFRRRLGELGGVSPTSSNTIEAFNEVIQRELAVLLKKGPGAWAEAGFSLAPKLAPTSPQLTEHSLVRRAI